MSRFYRKSAPGVRDGQTLRKNNWKRSPSFYFDSQSRLAIDRRRPGAGYRHLLMKRDIERFVNLIPNWNELSRGLDLISLDRGRRDYHGWYDRGAIGICAWPLEMSSPVYLCWVAEHQYFLPRIGARLEDNRPRGEVFVHLDPGRPVRKCINSATSFCTNSATTPTACTPERKKTTVRAAKTSRRTTRTIWKPLVLERYFDEFGLPEIFDGYASTEVAQPVPGASWLIAART